MYCSINTGRYTYEITGMHGKVKKGGTPKNETTLYTAPVERFTYPVFLCIFGLDMKPGCVASSFNVCNSKGTFLVSKLSVKGIATST